MFKTQKLQIKNTGKYNYFPAKTFNRKINDKYIKNKRIKEIIKESDFSCRIIKNTHYLFFTAQNL